MKFIIMKLMIFSKLTGVINLNYFSNEVFDICYNICNFKGCLKCIYEKTLFCGYVGAQVMKFKFKK